ncbi:ribokinase [Cucumibacter marinus]|uniref:ribokinase n=1 Tax=Cucumibacter marinus TaxID=1121252 RepID=UPI0004132D7C|nr:ribokinase [Cucumibacter marinus]
MYVLGSINLDIVLSVETLPAPGETVSASGMDRFSGGKGANQAIAAARADAKVSLFGAVGEDEAGATLVAYLEDTGINTEGVVRLADTPTGQAYIGVSAKGENAIIVVPGANHAFDKKPGAFELHTVFLSQLEMPVAAIKALFEAAAGRGLRVLNAAPAIDEGRDLFALTDVLIVNETELAHYANAAEVSARDGDGLVAQARALMVRDDQTVVITLGAEGVLAVTADDAIRVEGRKADVVDTTGAGDCFCGTLCTALEEGQTLKDAIRFANAAAAIAVTRRGAGPSMPARAEIEALLAKG